MRCHVFAAVLLIGVAALAQQGSAVVADPLGRGTWVVDEERDELALVDADGGVASFSVGSWPEKIVADSTGRLFVSARADGRIDVISPSLSFSSIEIGAEPKALVLDEKARRLYVGLVTERALAVVDLDSLTVTSKVELPAEPHALAKIGRSIAVLPRLSDSVFFVDTCLCKEKPRRVRLPAEGREFDREEGEAPRRRAWFGQALAVASEGLVVFHSSVDTGLSHPLDPELDHAESEQYGGVHRPVQAIVTLIADGEAHVLSAGHPYFAVPMAEITEAVVRDHLVYALSRTQATLHVARLDFVKGEPDDDRRVRWSPHPVGGAATGLLADREGVLVFSAADRQLQRYVRNPDARLQLSHSDLLLSGKDPEKVIDWGRVRIAGFWGKGPSGGPRVLKPNGATALGAGAFDAQLALGRKLFFDSQDPRISESSLSCATCHFDGRHDGLVWRQRGGRRQTPVLAGRVSDNAPYGWRGEHATLVKSLEATVKRIDGKGLPEAERAALARYLREGLRPILLPRGTQTDAVARGRELFHDSVVGCAQCHPSDAAFNDAALHDVGSLSSAEKKDLRVARQQPDGAFDTPDLRFLALSAPYFHDGSRQTLRAVIEKNKDRMGKTSHLSVEQVSALIAYLETL